MRRPLPLLTCAACVVGTFASAQTVPRADQADAIKRQQELEQKLRQSTTPGGASMEAPELFQGELKDVGPQSILASRQKSPKFEVSADSQFFYTSNQNLSETAKGTTLLVNTLQLAYAPTPIQTGRGVVAPRFGARRQWFNYGLGDSHGKGDTDFALEAFFAEAKWGFRPDWVAEVNVEWSRLLNDLETPKIDRHQFYSEWLPRFGLTRQVPFSETKVLSISWQVSYHITDSPDAQFSAPPAPRNTNDRLDNSFVAAYTHTFGPHLSVQPYYRLLLTRYGSQSARFDYLHSFGLSAYLPLCANASLRAFVSYEIKDSDAPAIPDYRKLDAGGGLNLSVRF